MVVPYMSKLLVMVFEPVVDRVRPYISTLPGKVKALSVMSLPVAAALPRRRSVAFEMAQPA